MTHFTVGNFEAEVLQSDVPVLVDFYADWCGPCKMLGPVIEQIASEVSGVKVGKINVDNETALAIKYQVQSIPALLVFKNGEVVKRHVGFAPKPVVEGLLKDL